MEEGPNDEFDPEVILDGDKIIDDFLGNLIDDDIVINDFVDNLNNTDIIIKEEVKPIKNIQDLPIELQNKIFYYAAEHPCAKMIKKGYADTRHNLQQDDDAYMDATHLTYDGNMDLSKRKISILIW